MIPKNEAPITNALNEAIRYGVIANCNTLKEAIDRMEEAIENNPKSLAKAFIKILQQDFTEYMYAGGNEIIPDTFTDVIVDEKTGQRSTQILHKKP